MKWTLVILCVLGTTCPVMAQSPWRLDVGLTFSRFEQQVKAEVGGARGERLVEETQFGLAAMGTYNVWGPVSLGLYMQYDVGFRAASRFSGFDADGNTIVTDQVGGSFQEFWAGPLVRLHWRTLFLEVAYGAVGVRVDAGRDDLPDEHGDTDDALRTLPSVAWMMALGGGVPVTDVLELVLRLEFRVRYYNRRTGGVLADELVHGTQNFTPFAGVAWRL